MESLLKGIPNVLVYLDDILVTGETQEQHIKNLHEVLSRFRDAGLHLKKQKCAFLARSVEYRFTIDQQGIHPSERKVKAIKAAPNLRNLTELKAYLGLLTYYGKFLPNIANIFGPLYHLLKKDIK